MTSSTGNIDDEDQNKGQKEEAKRQTEEGHSAEQLALSLTQARKARTLLALTTEQNVSSWTGYCFGQNRDKGNVLVQRPMKTVWVLHLLDLNDEGYLLKEQGREQ